MSTSGIELIVGMVHDPSFGPVLACGPGARTTGVIKDMAVRITPVTDLDAHEMLRSLWSFSLSRAVTTDRITTSRQWSSC